MEESRKEPRAELSVQGRYRTGTGVPRDVPIIELSAHGCRFFDRFGKLAIDTRLSIKIETIGPIPAQVKWREGQTVGVEFEQALYGPVFEHIRDKLAHKDDL